MVFDFIQLSNHITPILIPLAWDYNNIQQLDQRHTFLIEIYFTSAYGTCTFLSRLLIFDTAFASGMSFSAVEKFTCEYLIANLSCSDFQSFFIRNFSFLRENRIFIKR